MLSSRAETILRSIVGQYIAKATPVPSQSLTNEYALEVSSATIRNEMAHLEQEGYITRHHPSAGSIPSDKGYRYYVESLSEVALPLAEQLLIGHLFHQVEKKQEEWLNLAATLTAQLAQNVAIVTVPKSKDCRFKCLELVALQDSLALAIFVLQGAKIKQLLITLDRVIPQTELTTIANKINATYSGLTRAQILAKETDLSPTEKQLTDYLLQVMQAEDRQEYEETYVDGLHFILNQPEFTHSHRILALMELIEHRNLLKTVIPQELDSSGVRVIIGKENKAEVIRDYSVVISKYGLPEEAVGIITVIGPTRMPYARTISAINYLSSALNRLVAELYEEETPTELSKHDAN